MTRWVFFLLVVVVLVVAPPPSASRLQIVSVPYAQVPQWLDEHRLSVIEVLPSDESDMVSFVVREADHHWVRAADPSNHHRVREADAIMFKVLLWEPAPVGWKIISNNDEEPSVIVGADQVDFVRAQPETRWVEPWQPIRMHDAYGNWRVQSDERDVCNQTSPYFGCTPLWDAGLLGQGQILGIGDSGAYLRHCFFNDASCGPSTKTTPEPACGGTYLDPVCSSCVDYCLGGDGVNCHPAPSHHRSFNGYRTTVGDFDDRKVMHGTAVATVAAGSVVDSPLSQFLVNQGVVPRARLLMHDMSVDNGQSTVDVPSPLDTAYFPWFQTNGARVSSHSWGTPPISGYNSDSQAIDRWMWQNPDHLVVFSAGNEGDPVTFGNSLQIGPQAASKNALVVGATMGELELLLTFSSFAADEGLTAQSNATRWSANFLASFSSAGPTLDRRIKPDIVMPGQMVVTARADAARENDADGSCTWPDAIAGWSGTSFSAPLAAGYAVMLRQWAIERKGIANPSSALIKALFAAASRPLLGINYYYAAGNKMVEANQLPRPEWAWGHGRPVLEQLLDPVRTFLDERQSVSTGASITYCTRSYVYAHSTNTLDIALAWTDPPGTVGGNQYVTKLVNDIDLSAVDAACDVFYGNYRGVPDHDNNLEKLSIPVGNALAIDYAVYHLVVARAAKIQVPPQTWSLVINERNDAPQALQVQQITLDLATGTTNLPSYHPCSVMASTCHNQIAALMGSGGTPSASQLPSLSPSATRTPSASASSASTFALTSLIPLVVALLY